MKSGYHGWTKTAVRWPNRIQWKIDAYAVVGFAFTFLVIFMTIRPMVTLRFMADLPRARFVSPVPGAAREDAQIVSVSRDGQNLLSQCQSQDWRPARADSRKHKKWRGRKIYVRADARARYGDIGQVLDEIRKTGIQNVCFFAERVSP